MMAEENSWRSDSDSSFSSNSSSENNVGNDALFAIGLRKRIMSIMLCTNWVCAGTFVDHEWVSSRTIFQQEEDFLKHGNGFQN